ncbi:uncharacterized protein CDV56_108326 [Aspergillus thermomutatus]|uniref:Protein kinase domain-containing protein n=1 Tax=Aspergillus thermomutatus TaxID=41047 RepID=A0A397HW88_ASPTH|nr:uncharacterized protein CDV56_108326 [Aspergillus thermomutatus]RHZ65836.1 hypothetical protein CDV56_108326 [Aspergillus thermomutatus]
MHHSQLAPLPNDLPFQIVSKTIGQGAYACIKKACPSNADNPVFAVKFIHKEYAARHGKISPRQLQMEATVHKHIGDHNNIISFFQTGEDSVWRWIAMELAEGGDLFDKIEADEGVGEDIAHVYFSQLISAVGYMHSKGVGHRDIKPENMLLTADGNLKIADFGLATLFEYKGVTKLSTTFCGSPPYIAPEVISCSNRGQVKGAGYRPDLVDIWSCGIVLFVLLAGNTPWDSPTDSSYEFHEYVATNARTSDELWQKLPTATLSLLRGMLNIDPSNRFSLEDVRRHPWFTRQNRHLALDGKLKDPINLATTMFESLHIDFSQDPLSRPHRTGSFDPERMRLDDEGDLDTELRISSTQPEMPRGDMLVDWDTPHMADVFSSTQPMGKPSSSDDMLMAGYLEDEPSMSQFSPHPSVPLSRTQKAQRFRDIVPARPMTRFFSTWELKILVPLVCEALHRLGVPVPSVPAVSAGDTSAMIRIITRDGRMCTLQGKVVIECVSEGLFEIEFMKVKGDPLEWRRFFKKVAVLFWVVLHRAVSGFDLLSALHAVPFQIPSMENLPVEILSKIIDYLTPVEQAQLQSVSKRLFALARDNTRWRLHCYEESWVASEAARQNRSTSESLLARSTAPLSSLGQTSLLSLIQPQHRLVNGDSSNESGQNEVQNPSFAERARAAASWDPSYEGEDVDWYSEYIARHGPMSFSWLQQPFTRKNQGEGKIHREVKGMGLLRDWSSARQNRVVAPLEDGSVCIWDLNHSHSIDSRATKGRVLGVSAPGILMADLSKRRDHPAPRSALEFINLGECVSVDSIRRRAYMAVGNALNEVDLETLQVISQQRYPWSIFALSQETDYSVPLTVATTLSIHIHDSRLSASEEEEAINLRCEEPVAALVPESQVYARPDSPLLQLQPDGRPPHRIRSPDPSQKGADYAPLFQPGPLSLLHPPAPHVNTILLAGRFPSILQYDRRFFPRLQNTVHSGGRLCGLASIPAPHFPVSSGSAYPQSHKVVACGEYKGRGSLELYNLTPSSLDSGDSPSDMSSNMNAVYQNRQSAARSKVLSVESHGTRIVYSDAEGNIKWVERDGRVDVRRFNLNSYLQQAGGQTNRQSHLGTSDAVAQDDEEEEDGASGLWRSVFRSQTDGEVARKILPTGGNLTGDELLLWTGERIGRVVLSTSSGDNHGEEDDDDEMSIDGDLDDSAREELRSRRREQLRQEREYARRMRRALERQADEVRRMGGFGL